MALQLKASLLLLTLSILFITGETRRLRACMYRFLPNMCWFEFQLLFLPILAADVYSAFVVSSVFSAAPSLDPKVIGDDFSDGLTRIGLTDWWTDRYFCSVFFFTLPMRLNSGGNRIDSLQLYIQSCCSVPPLSTSAVTVSYFATNLPQGHLIFMSSTSSFIISLMLLILSYFSLWQIHIFSWISFQTLL